MKITKVVLENERQIRIEVDVCNNHGFCYLLENIDNKEQLMGYLKKDVEKHIGKIANAENIGIFNKIKPKLNEVIS